MTLYARHQSTHVGPVCNVRLSARRAERTQQSGIVLITVALFLVVLGALGAASMRSASVQERISGVFYDRTVALASSEAALSEAKEYLLAPDFESSSAASKVRDGSLLYSSTTNDGLSVLSWVQSNTNWISGAFAVLLGTADGITDALLRVKSPPAYIVDRFPDMGISTTTKFQVFRVTARGAGGRQENAVYTHILSRIPVSTGS
jgi:Tfp pilus assembly protein PilX